MDYSTGNISFIIESDNIDHIIEMFKQEIKKKHDFSQNKKSDCVIIATHNPELEFVGQILSYKFVASFVSSSKKSSIFKSNDDIDEFNYDMISSYITVFRSIKHDAILIEENSCLPIVHTFLDELDTNLFSYYSEISNNDIEQLCEKSQVDLSNIDEVENFIYERLCEPNI